MRVTYMWFAKLGVCGVTINYEDPFGIVNCVTQKNLSELIGLEHIENLYG